MAERFTRFILDLAQDPQTLQRFQDDPEAVVKAAGLSPAEQAILTSRDTALIRDAIVTDTGLTASQSEAGVTVVIWTHTRVREAEVRLETLEPSQLADRFSRLTKRIT